MLASRHIKREKDPLPVDVRRVSNSVFERRMSTGSGLFASLGSGLVETLGQIVFVREEKLSKTNLLESRQIKREKDPLVLVICLQLPPRLVHKLFAVGKVM